MDESSIETILRVIKLEVTKLSQIMSEIEALGQKLCELEEKKKEKRHELYVLLEQCLGKTPEEFMLPVSSEKAVIFYLDHDECLAFPEEHPALEKAMDDGCSEENFEQFFFNLRAFLS